MSAQPTNPWFGLSMALVGIIIGYGVAITTGGGIMQPAAPSGGTAPVAAQPTPTAEPTYDDLLPFDSKTDYYRGNPNAKIAMIEYSDYECPFCSRHHPTLQQAVDEYGDDIVWVYRHYPLSFHPNAQPSAEAAECVGEIGGNDKFWEFTDLLFSKGSDPANHAGYAKEIGVDVAAFQTCVDSGKYTEKVNQQLAEGTTAGVRGTPGTFIQNTSTEEIKYISGAQPYVNVKAAIDSLQ